MNNRNIIGTVVTEALADPAFQLQLAEALSHRLQQRLAGESLYIPKATDTQRKQRNEQIRRELDSGVSIAEIQSRYRLTSRTVFRIRGKKS